MAIIPANETAYRQRVRRRLTLDLFTRYGTFWEQIDALRDQWRVDVIVGVPPEPSFHTEAVGVLDRSTMPERFHMPTNDYIAEEHYAALEQSAGPEAAQYMRESQLSGNVRIFLKCLSQVWRDNIAPDLPGELGGDWRNGANVNGWMTWAPFLSACVMYDPPPDSLLEFAEHDDHNAAALTQRTFSQDGEQMVRAGMMKAKILGGELQAMEQYRDALQDSYIESTHSPEPIRPAGKPKLDDLEAVQAAIWQRLGKSHMESAELGGWISTQESYDTRGRKNKNITRVNRGKEILKSRKYSD